MEAQELHGAIGKLISRFGSLETMTKYMVCKLAATDRGKPTDGRHQERIQMVVDQLSFRQATTCLSALVLHHWPSETSVKDLAGRMDAAATFRNQLVHGGVGVVREWTKAPDDPPERVSRLREFIGGLRTRTTRAGISQGFHEFSAAAFEREHAVVDGLLNDILAYQQRLHQPAM